MKPKPNPTEVLARLRVDMNAGRIYWIDGRNREAEAGARNRHHAGNGYWHVKWMGRMLKRSHIVFMAANGRWPIQQIDHINGNSLDDRIENLREVTPAQNAWNRKKHKRKQGLPMGVHPVGDRYHAIIMKDYRSIYVGSFASPEQAAAAYQHARRELFGEYA